MVPNSGGGFRASDQMCGQPTFRGTFLLPKVLVSHPKQFFFTTPARAEAYHPRGCRVPGEARQGTHIQPAPGGWGSWPRVPGHSAKALRPEGLNHVFFFLAGRHSLRGEGGWLACPGRPRPLSLGISGAGGILCAVGCLPSPP